MSLRYGGVRGLILSTRAAAPWILVPIYAADITPDGVDWEPTTCTFYFDGKQVAQIPTPAGMNVPMNMIANLAVVIQPWNGIIPAKRPR